MEKLKKTNLFPPLAVPEAYKRRRLNTSLSKEGQTVKNELEHRQFIDQFLRQRVTRESETDEKRNSLHGNGIEEFCIACAQRVSLQPLVTTSRERRKNAALSRERLMGCICIICKRALPLSPHAAGSHRIVINSENHGQEQGNRTNTMNLDMRNKFEVQRDFQISSLNYDSRIEDMQHRLEIEQCMPPKEVIKRSERKCQLWLLRNEEHIRVRTSSQYR